MPNVLGARIRKLRQDQGMVLSELSRLSGISTPSLSEFERGKKSPSLTTLARIAEALSVDVALLVSDPALKSEAEAMLGDAFLRARNLSEEGRTSIIDYIEFTLAKERQGRK